MFGKCWKLLSLLLLAVLAVLAALPVTYIEVGDGGFRQAAFRITVVDRHDMTLKKVSMRVTRVSGENSPCYPVSDYDGVEPIRSDENGVIQFHHVNLGAEYPVKRRYLFTGHLLSQQEPPMFVCRFFRGEQEVAVARFNDYFGHSNEPDSWWRELSTSRLRWTVMENCTHLPVHLRIDNRVLNQELVFPIINATVRTDK